MESQAVSYTVTDEISVTYGVEEITDGTGAEDAEFERISGSYTAGGMTVTYKVGGMAKGKMYGSVDNRKKK